MRPPSSSVTVDIHVDKSLYEETIRTVCKELLTGWAAAGDIHLHQITGGITNVLYKASMLALATVAYAGGWFLRLPGAH